ncbi:MAG: hypothetical protein QOJ62_2358 [Actinomycetota bacterium]|jgi:hypothetical protein|nr:hypothetical protein [Actinomycetota bacterium]
MLGDISVTGGDVAESVDHELVGLLAGVIAWELEAQNGVNRSPSQIPTLLADSILDYFEVRVKPRITPPSP